MQSIMGVRNKVNKTIRFGALGRNRTDAVHLKRLEDNRSRTDETVFQCLVPDALVCLFWSLFSRASGIQCCVILESS